MKLEQAIINLARGDFTRTEGLMLWKLVINDWDHVSSKFVLEDRGRMVKWHVPVWADLLGEVQMQKNGVTMIVSKTKEDCPKETVKYI